MRIGRVAGITDTGRRRRQNEDAYVCEPPLFAVADGMGGAQAGELASRLAAAAIEETAADATGEAGVVAIVRAANKRVFERALEDPAVAGMGTTATVALVDEQAGTIALAQVGDSRPTGTGTARSSSSRPTTRSSESSCAPAGSPRTRRPCTRTGR